MKIKGEIEDKTIVRIEIPMKCVNGIIHDIDNLFKFKDDSGKDNIGATGATIDLKQTLEQLKEKHEMDARLMVIQKDK